jgi:glycosyltransferase involved in cell wall biosynthesis
MNILFIYYDYYEPNTNAGALRILEIIKIIQDRGAKVTMLSMRGNNNQYAQYLEKYNICCIADDGSLTKSSFAGFRRFLAINKFDIAILSDCGIYIHYAPSMRKFCPGCKIVFDTIDLKSVRFARKAVIDRKILTRIKSFLISVEEKQAFWDADRIWVVIDDERNIIQEKLGLGYKTDVIPTIHIPEKQFASWKERRGIIFLGGYKHIPNVDAIRDFMTRVFPLIRRELPDVPFTIAGSYPPQDFFSYHTKDPLVNVTGFIENHRELLLINRIGVAPLRYGAGIKGKIGEYLACGLPCVASSSGAEGMGFRDRVDIMIADSPEEFARKTIDLYQNQELWDKISTNGIKYISQRLSVEAIKPTVVSSFEMLENVSLYKRKDHYFSKASNRAVANIFSRVKTLAKELNKYSTKQ